MKIRTSFSHLGTFFLLLIVSGCAPATEPMTPKYLDPSFVQADVQEIIILPIADIRKDQSYELTFQRLTTSAGSRIHFQRPLRRKGYTISFAEDFGAVPSINEDDLYNADPSWVISLGPQDARWILLVALEDLVTRTTFGKALVVECLGILFDKGAGKAVWRHEAIGENSAPGVAGLIIPTRPLVIETLGRCIDQLTKQFPPKS